MLTRTTARSGKLLAASFHENMLTTPVNAYLVYTGDRLVLVDTGAAGLFGPTLGKLMANLAASGYRPEKVDDVLITHLHPDLIGGPVAAGKRAFPNATLPVELGDAAFWQSPKESKNAPAARTGFPGHTLGHTLYMIESKGQRLALWGDVAEIAAVSSSTNPTWRCTSTSTSPNPPGCRPRPSPMRRAAATLAGAHLPFPGIGHVRAERNGYTWVPSDYQAVP